MRCQKSATFTHIVDGSEIRQNQLRLLVYLRPYRVLDIAGGWEWDF